MTDFVRPYGKFIGMHKEIKVALFNEIANVINARKYMSVSAALRHRIFKDSVPLNVYRGALSGYAAAFIAMVNMNIHIAHEANYPERINYVVDSGNPFAEQLRLAHLMAMAQENQNRGGFKTGALLFDSDDNVTALQAADVIAWTARRKHSGSGLTGEFLPLEEILKERFDVGGKALRTHAHIWIDDSTGKRTADRASTDTGQLLQEAEKAIDNLNKDIEIMKVKTK